VHHAHHVHGYRRVHRAAHAPSAGTGTGTDAGSRAASTEELREALVEARALFQDLTAPVRKDEKALPREKREKTEPRDKTDAAPATTAQTDSSRGRTHAPWAFNRRHVKGS
jgi:hypothetical protein